MHTPTCNYKIAEILDSDCTADTYVLSIVNQKTSTEIARLPVTKKAISPGMHKTLGANSVRFFAESMVGTELQSLTDVAALPDVQMAEEFSIIEPDWGCRLFKEEIEGVTVPHIHFQDLIRNLNDSIERLRHPMWEDMIHWVRTNAHVTIKYILADDYRSHNVKYNRIDIGPYINIKLELGSMHLNVNCHYHTGIIWFNGSWFASPNDTALGGNLEYWLHQAYTHHTNNLTVSPGTMRGLAKSLENGSTVLVLETCTKADLTKIMDEYKATTKSCIQQTTDIIEQLATMTGSDCSIRKADITLTPVESGMRISVGHQLYPFLSVVVNKNGLCTWVFENYYGNMLPYEVKEPTLWPFKASNKEFRFWLRQGCD